MLTSLLNWLGGYWILETLQETIPEKRSGLLIAHKALAFP